LQHTSSSNSGAILTDVNVLAEEYLKLSYHGFRSKDKSVHVTIHSTFDPDIEQINIVPQDIGRVFLNIYNNAFFSVIEKAKKKIADYIPTVTVQTKKEGDKVNIIVHDNGLGITSKYVPKVFQPFFTTKPTGEGTGLGLSLSYEIVKAHQGEIKAESVEGEYAQFTVELID
jgi:signal transduction histidine kinase